MKNSFIDINKIASHLIRFGDEMIIPDPRGMVDTEEQFLEQYESAVKYEDEDY